MLAVGRPVCQVQSATCPTKRVRRVKEAARNMDIDLGHERDNLLCEFMIEVGCLDGVGYGKSSASR